VRIYAHLTTDTLTLYIDTSGEPLFKRGWREDKGEAPLKETLAAAMLAACGWGDQVQQLGADANTLNDLHPLYDPCCGSGTIAIEAAQMACRIAPGSLRRFAFEKFLPFQPHVWDALKKEADNAVLKRPPGSMPLVFGSDVAFRMVDFAQRNAQRAGVADVNQFRGGDALQRMPPIDSPGVMLLNPPYGERISVAGVSAAREHAVTEDGGEFFSQLASHWKKNYAGWTGWILTPDLKLPGKMRLKESRRVPLWNGPIECRLFRFDMMAGKMGTGSPKAR
jgi:putative N6-adenine-specific DNA methylase